MKRLFHQSLDWLSDDCSKHASKSHRNNRWNSRGVFSFTYASKRFVEKKTREIVVYDYFSKHASMSPRNNGWGFKGRDLNSG